MEFNYVNSVPKDAKPINLKSKRTFNHNYDEILLICKKLHNYYVEGLNQKKDIKTIRNELKEQYPDFELNYNSLFKLCTSDDYDLNKLTMFIQMASSVQRKEISEHDASVQIGELLVNEYVKPKLK
jgi:Lhr-like helicase